MKPVICSRNEGDPIQNLYERGWCTFEIHDSLGIEKLASIGGQLALQLGSASIPELSTIGPHMYEMQKYLANTGKAMGLHTDNVYLKEPCNYVLMACVEPAERGGDTLLCDARKVIPLIVEADYKSLGAKIWQWKQPIRYGRGTTEPFRVLSGNAIRWWRYGLMNQEPELVALADSFDEILHSHNAVETIALKEGQAILLDNSRILHGRTTFLGKREMLRVRF